ncbi:hypothetical protein Tco_0052297 [Tanacetum coccineum]
MQQENQGLGHEANEATFQVVMLLLPLINSTMHPNHTDVSAITSRILGYRQVFEDLPLEQDILSFIRDLGHTGDITYLTDVNVDYLHQPWRAFATVINKCLSGKETGMDKIHSQRSSLIPHVKGFIYFKENQDVWHTDRDDTLFTSMRCISRHEDTQAPKPKYIRKKADFDTSLKKKPVQATKGTRLKSKAKVAKPDKKKRLAKKTKAKGLAVLSEVSLTEAEQIKLDTKRSKKDFHVSHASGSGDGVDTQSNVHDDDKESWVDSEDKDNNDDDGDSDDHDDDNNDERIESDRDEIPDPKLTNFLFGLGFFISDHYIEPTEFEIQEMVNILVSGEAGSFDFIRLYDEVRARTLFVLSSSSNRGRLLGIIDLMRQKNKRMKQEGLNRQIGKLQDVT